MIKNQLRVSTPLLEVSYPVTASQTAIITMFVGIALFIAGMVMLPKSAE